MAQKFTVPITVRQLSSAGSDAFTIYVDGDTYSRLQVQAGGRLVWGAGDAASDTNLYRDAANVLKTDDTFKAAALFVDGIEIDTTGATNGNALVFNGTKFAPGEGGGGASITISDTPPSSPTAGDLWFESDTGKTFVYYDSFWVEAAGSAPLLQSLDDISDVTITSPSNGQVLKYNGTAWVNGTDNAGTSINAIDDIGDVTITSATSGQFLKWNGTAWVNDAIDLGTDTTGNYVSDVTAGTGVTVTHTPSEGSSPTIAIGQAVGTTDNVQFNDVTVSGNLTVSGTTTTLNTENLLVEDNIVVLNSGVTGSPTLNAGIEIERGTSSNVSIRWNETSDNWELTNDGTNYAAVTANPMSDSRIGAILTMDIGV